MSVCVVCEKRLVFFDTAVAFARENGFEFFCDGEGTRAEYELVFGEDTICLRHKMGKKTVSSYVDFAEGAQSHRRKYGGGKGQSIAKAVGLNKARGIRVLDATAGMGGDAFVLASLGCSITMVERSPVVRMLLQDGLRRARLFAEDGDAELLEIVDRMTLLEGDSLALLAQKGLERPQVVYLDPMFPQRRKSAEVKKEMQFFHDVVGSDNDADGLLEPALALAENRVVVKRPKVAPFLAAREPGYQLLGKSNRFDIYPLKAFEIISSET
ncbi:class I SAM-dependent methyltransferase [Teredinibacter haidensis]|uniref:class I SAM-dependent methyltransferase n=1 Tax=Teredinibacter haidensis TaxID=2731755 RepID=UPI000948BCCF|nr:class I SAM-dependent methyltransferase [Teredinibacter haidensis]